MGRCFTLTYRMEGWKMWSSSRSQRDRGLLEILRIWKEKMIKRGGILIRSQKKVSVKRGGW